MWFGTYDGLNRYDGYEFKVFRNKFNDSTSLPHNYIYAINEDLQNNLWVGTGQGVGIYTNLTSTFHPAYYVGNDNKIRGKITWSINVIKTDADGNVFTGTNGGGLFIRFKNRDVAVQLLIKKGANETADYNVQAITADKKHRLWLYIKDVGLCLFDYAAGKIRLVNNTLKAASCLAADEEEKLWIGTNKGLYKYSIASNSLVASYNEASGQLTSDNLTSLSFDKTNNLWIGTEGGGINILNPATGKTDYILPGEGRNKLSSESVFAIYEDKESRKWLGTVKGGINIIDPKKTRFQTIAHDPLNPNSLIYNFVSSFYEDGDKNLWIGTDGGGMSIWNRRQNSFTNFRHDPGKNNSLSNNSVTCIKKDYLNNIWMATFGGGINRFNRAAGSFERFKCINDVTGEENKNAWLLLEDHEQNLWASTFGDGRLYRFSRSQNRFEVFGQELYDLIALMEDRNGTLWAGNSHQLISIDKQNKKHNYYETGKPVRTIYEDKKGNFWIGSEGGGLILFDRKQGKIAFRYSDADGLCNNAVLNILEDDRGYLWLSTFNGLSEFNPADKSFKNFYKDDGLQSNQFLYNAALRLQSGEAVFGGIKGFNIFFPDSLHSRTSAPPVLLTGLRINNTPVTKESRYVTKISGDKIDVLKIPFNEAVLSFDFAALEYSAPGKISYACYLEGWDKGWNYTGNLRTANYTHLSEGSYVLRIKATNAEGVWNSQQVRLKVIVLPPWYRSWWAYAIYLIMAGAAIVIYQRYRVNQAKLKYEVALANLNAEKERAELEKERTERERAQAEFEKTQAQYQMEKAERETERVINEREKEINEKRLSFFTNVSHEFRTPLTLIINPIKDLLDKKNSKKEETGDLNIIYRNARRLLSLVDQLLLFRKADAGADKLKVTRLNFYTLCKEVYLAFVQQAKALKIDYEFECANEKVEIYADREKMEIILYNLISNALKYTPQGGKVIFTVTETDENVEVRVADSGYGIPKETGDKLFERFYQVQEKGIPTKAGFGIGLYMVKHFVESHKGKISYESEPGNGTTFFIQLQKGKEHFSDQTIFDETANETVFLKELVEDQAAVIDNKDLKEGKKELEALINENQSRLIVDDDEQIRQYIARIFMNKFAVYQAINGEEGLNLAQQYIPDIIISDVNMQGMSGIDLCKTLKESTSLSHIPVILLTGSSSTETKLQGVEGGADDYITKPFEKELLVARVASLLKSRTTLQKYFYNEITLQQNPLKISAEYKEFLEKCMAIVERHLDDNNFSIRTLASEIGMSHSNLYKRVKSISGQSVNAFIRFIRLRKAAELLINTNNNVNETAAQVGFNDVKYFREQFSKLFGMNPSEYIKKYRKVFGKSFNLNEEGYKSES
jgi:signal transduction histidine kinase/ligand-binding sensor domain-containing protein/DNA-binding response OmpR family regulator